jgi:AcrR family transcriptional regulator
MTITQPDRPVRFFGPTGPHFRTKGSSSHANLGTVYVHAMTSSNALPMRADARRNLERILQAAREAFAEGGLDVGVEEIARRAGVGKATFFRRFPTKEALVSALYEDFVVEVETAIDDALAQHPDDPLGPLRAFLEHSMRTQATNKAFFEAVAARYIPPADMTDRVMAGVERVMKPACEAGLLRPGVEAGDISTATKMLGAAIRPLDGVLLCQEAWPRYLDLVLTGLLGETAMPGVAADPCTMVREFSAKTG